MSSEINAVGEFLFEENDVLQPFLTETKLRRRMDQAHRFHHEGHFDGGVLRDILIERER